MSHVERHWGHSHSVRQAVLLRFSVQTFHQTDDQDVVCAAVRRSRYRSHSKDALTFVHSCGYEVIVRNWLVR